MDPEMPWLERSSLSPLFCEWASSALGYIFSRESSLSLSLSLSLAIPQFGLLSQVSSLRLSLGHSCPVLTLSNAAHASPFSPHLLVADVSIWATSLLGFAVRQIICGFYLFFPSSYVVLWDSKTPHRSAHERVSWCLETSPPSWLPPWDRSQSLNLLSLFLSFICFPTSFWRQLAAFLGAWCPLPGFKNCFVESVQCSNDISVNL